MFTDCLHTCITVGHIAVAAHTRQHSYYEHTLTFTADNLQMCMHPTLFPLSRSTEDEARTKHAQLRILIYDDRNTARKWQFLIIQHDFIVTPFFLLFCEWWHLHAVITRCDLSPLVRVSSKSEVKSPPRSGLHKEQRQGIIQYLPNYYIIGQFIWHPIQKEDNEYNFYETRYSVKHIRSDEN